MNSIEEDLKQALRRREPQADFAGKVMGLVNSGEGLEPEKRRGPNKVLVFPLRPKVLVWLATAAAAACVVALFVTWLHVADRGNKAVSDGVSASNPQVVTPQSTGGQMTEAVPLLKDNGRGSSRRQAPNYGSQAVINRVRNRPFRGIAGKGVPEEARHAEEQLRLALAITSAKLGYAQRSIQEADGTGAVDREVNR
jgi:hypothetical protein